MNRSLLALALMGLWLTWVAPIQAQTLPKTRAGEPLRLRITTDLTASAGVQPGVAPEAVQNQLKQQLASVGIDSAEANEKGRPALHLRLESMDDGRNIASGSVELLVSWPDGEGGTTGIAYSVKWDRRREQRMDLAGNVPQAIDEVLQLFLRDLRKANPNAVRPAADRPVNVPPVRNPE